MYVHTAKTHNYIKQGILKILIGFNVLNRLTYILVQEARAQSLLQ